MGILSRFGDIISSNVNALLDKCEDPEKMIDQTLRNLNKDLAQVKSETAGIMAEETAAKRKLDECVTEVDKLQNYAKKALEKGNEGDAKRFLEQKAREEQKLVSLKQAYDLAKSNADKMRQMHQKLTSQINELEARRDGLKAKISVAKAQENINKVNTAAGKALGSLSEFDRLEDKVNKKLDKANAMAELNNAGNSNVDDLINKYSTPEANVDDELAKLKAEMGLN